MFKAQIGNRSTEPSSENVSRPIIYTILSQVIELLYTYFVLQLTSLEIIKKRAKV